MTFTITDNLVSYSNVGVGIGTTPYSSGFLHVNTVKAYDFQTDTLQISTGANIGIGTTLPTYTIHHAAGKPSRANGLWTTNLQSQSNLQIEAISVASSAIISTPFIPRILATGGSFLVAPPQPTIISTPTLFTTTATRWFLTLTFDAYRTAIGGTIFNVRMGTNPAINYDIDMTYSYYFSQANTKYQITLQKIIDPSLYGFATYPYQIGYIHVSGNSGNCFDTTTKFHATMLELISSH